MGFFSKLFLGEPKKIETDEVNPMENSTKYEKYLEQCFGLKEGKGGWAFEGGSVIDDMVQQLSQPDICIDVLKALQTKMAFSKVCIVTGHKVVLVCDTKPAPVCIVSSLSANGIADMVSSSIKTSGEKINTYKGTWVVTI
jgi:hypothetical protein